IYTGRPTENPARRCGPEHLAYVIYTSGSTGRPKGVVGLHKGVMNRISWMRRTCPFEAGETCVLRTSVNFVDHVAELFSPLLQGVPSVLLPEKHMRDTIGIVDTLSAHKAARVVLVPSLLKALLEQEDEYLRKLDNVRYWFCSGEALPDNSARLFYAKFPDGQLWNIYGSSEVSADVLACAVESERDEHQGVAIGRPVSNTRAYLLDSGGQVLPPGIAGELCIAGAGLARGYLNRPELTAEKFVEVELFGRTERIYRTGDLARRLPDGNLEYLGRIDHQIKLRGFRIEPGEVEAALMQHEAVGEAVITLYDPDDNGQLAAYLTAESDHDDGPLIAELKDLLGKRLPDYMVPTYFTVLNEMPLTPNGKIDRKALPEPAIEITAGASPATPGEELLANLWAVLLKRDV
ncbi:MAG: non-ribosomal peptide synthetase, partial [Candidatus Electrothrix sp. EH2]|nr:non-ribosomal peptide synthetase [Candidatus Electrothrix sp. EH2]